MSDDTMRLLKGIWLDERAEVVAQEKGWTMLQARRYLQDQEIINRRAGGDRRAVARRGSDRRSQ